MEVQACNLMFALLTAINDQRRAEREHGFTRDSALVIGFEELYRHVQSGGQITVVHQQNG